MTPEPIAVPIQPVEPGYRNGLRLAAVVFWVPASLGSLVIDRLILRDFPFASLVPALVALIALGAIIVVPNRIARRLGYSVDGEWLRVVRGWTFHSDTIVPFVRVQHIDVNRGPIDKMVGTASLVVHTAGTHNSIVTLPGLSPDRAAELREIIRSAIRTDIE